MKKSFVVFVCLAMILAKGYGQESIFSLGIGGFFGAEWGGGIEATISPYKMTVPMEYLGGGGFAFIDATYVEASFGYFTGAGSWEEKTDAPGVSNKKLGDVLLSSLNIGALLKYPFMVSDSVKLFPALGVMYQAVLSAKYNNDDEEYPEDFSAIWFQFGGGIDYNFSERFYLRFEILYGLRPKNKLEERYIDAMNILSSGYSGVKTENRLGHGPTIKLALGINL